MGAKTVVKSYDVNTSGSYAYLADELSMATTRRHYMRYRDGRYDPLGWGWLGFREIADVSQTYLWSDTGGNRVSADTGIDPLIQVKRFDNVTYDETTGRYPNAGHLESEWTASSDTSYSESSDFFDEIVLTSCSYKKTSYQYQEYPEYGGATYYTFTTGRTTTAGYNKECNPDYTMGDGTVDGKSTTTFTPDSSGNVAWAQTTTEGRSRILEVSADYLDIATDTTWVKGFPKTTVTCSTENSIKRCRAERRDYDTVGILQQITTDPQSTGTGGLEMVETLTHDAYGNVTSVVREDTLSKETRAACTAYETDEHIFPRVNSNNQYLTSFVKYDPVLGVPMQEVDPNGFQTRKAYDGFGRLRKEVRPDGTATWNSNALAIVEGRSRIQTTIKTTDNSESTEEYDTQGRVRRRWTRALGQVSDSIEEYWKWDQADAADRPTHETMSNGQLEIGRAFDDLQDGVLQQTTAKSNAGGTSTQLQETLYGYDLSRNLISRSDSVTGVNETYCYDGLNRVTDGAVNAAVVCGSGADYHYDYADDGNLNSSLIAGAYVYDPGRPHQAVQVGQLSYGYDANGNQRTRPDGVVLYNLANKPRVYLRGTIVSGSPSSTQCADASHCACADVNMRGRMYDPHIAKFLSPDPIVSTPLSGQSWNPYAYVRNDPLGIVDPGGYDGFELTFDWSWLGWSASATPPYGYNGAGGAWNIDPSAIFGSSGFSPASFNPADGGIQSLPGPSFWSGAEGGPGFYGAPPTLTELLPDLPPGAEWGQFWDPKLTSYQLDQINFWSSVGKYRDGSDPYLDPVIWQSKEPPMIVAPISVVGAEILGALGAAEVVEAAEGSVAAAAEGEIAAIRLPAGAMGFKTFEEFKAAFGEVGPDFQWHHIVEQRACNIASFGELEIHNTKNLIPVEWSTHQTISGYYSSYQDFTGGMRVRDWLSSQSFEAQHDFGLGVLKMFGASF